MLEQDWPVLRFVYGCSITKSKGEDRRRMYMYASLAYSEFSLKDARVRLSRAKG